MPSPSAFVAISLSSTRLILLGLGIALATSGSAQVQIPEQLLQDEKITVVEISAQQALQGLQREHDELSRTKGPNHPDTREVLGQLTEVKRRLGALGMLGQNDGSQNSATPPASTAASATASQNANADSIPLNENQIEIMRLRLQEMRQQLGPEHPTVQRMAELIIASGGTLPAAMVPSNAVSPEERVAEQDPWRILLGLVQRVAALEAEVASLRVEVQQLRSTAPDLRNSMLPESLPKLPVGPRRETSPAVPIPQ